MKKLYGFTVFTMVTWGCQKSEGVSEFTGNETTYSLQQGSAHSISGSVIFKERKDGKITAVIQIDRN